MTKTQHNIFLRLAALMILMIMSVGAAWGETVQDYYVSYSDQNSVFWYEQSPSEHGATFSVTNNKLTINNPSATENIWNLQCFIANGITGLEVGKKYTATFKAKSSASNTHVNMGLGVWGDDKRDDKYWVAIPNEWTEVSVDFTAVTNESSFLLMQSGTEIGTIEIEWVRITHVNPTTLDEIVPITNDYTWIAPTAHPSWASNTIGEGFIDTNYNMWVYGVTTSHLPTSGDQNIDGITSAVDVKNNRGLVFSLAGGKTWIIRVHFRSAQDRGIVIKEGYPNGSVLATHSGSTTNNNKEHLILETTVTPTTNSLYNITGATSNSAYIKYIEFISPVYASTTNPGNDNYWWQWAAGDRAWSIDVKQNVAYDMKNRLHVYTGTGGGIYNQGVTWSIINENNYCGASITDDGIVTTTEIGKAHVRATVKTSASDTKDLDVEITSRKGENPTLTALRIYNEDKTITGTTITHNVPNSAPCGESNPYTMRITPSTTTTDVYVNGTKLTKVSGQEYYECNIIVLETVGQANAYTIRLDDGYDTSTGALTPHYESTYTVNIVRESANSTNISSSSIAGSAIYFTDKKATNNFSAYTDGGQDQTLSITTESSTAAVKLSTKKPATESDMNKVAPWTELTKSGSTHTATLVAPLAGNECYYYIDVEDGGTHAYYELKLTTPAGGTTTAGTASSETTAFTSDYPYIFDNLTNTGTETPQAYLLFGDNHFQYGNSLSSYAKSTNASYGDGTHQNSLRLKGFDQNSYVKFKLSAGQTVTAFGDVNSGRWFVVTNDNTHGNINNSGVVLASGSGQVSYTATADGTYYIAAYNKSGENWGVGADLYLCAIEVTREAKASDLTPVSAETNWNFNERDNGTPIYGEIYANTLKADNTLLLITPRGEALGFNDRDKKSYTLKPGATLVNGKPDKGFAFKVTGPGTITVVGNSYTREFCYITDEGETGSVTGSGTVTMKYSKRDATTIYVYPTNSSGTQFYAIKWTPHTGKIFEITHDGSDITPNAYKQYALSTKTASQNLSVTVLKEHDTDVLELSKQLTSVSETPEDYQQSRVTQSSTSATATFSLTSPSEANTTVYYKLKVTPVPGGSAPSRVAASEDSGDIYVFAVTTQGSGVQTVMIDGTGDYWDNSASGYRGYVPTGWALHYDKVPHTTFPADQEWVKSGELSGGSRVMIYPDGGVTTKGCYLSTRDDGGTNQAVQLMKCDPVNPSENDIRPTLDLPSGHVKFTLLVTGRKQAGKKVGYKIERDQNTVIAEVQPTELTAFVADNTPITDYERLTVDIPNVTAGKYYLKIQDYSENNWDGVLILGYEVAKYEEGYSTELQMVKVNNQDITTINHDNVYTFTAPTGAGEDASYPLYVMPKSQTATVEMCGPYRATNEIGSGWTSVGNVKVSNFPGVPLYYCVKVEDNGQTGYYWVEMRRPAESGEPYVIGSHRKWDSNGSFGSDQSFKSNTVLKDYLKLIASNDKPLSVHSNGLYLEGTGDISTRTLMIKVSGKGKLRIRGASSGSGNDNTRYLKVTTADGSPLAAMSNENGYATGTTIHEIAYNGTDPTDIYIYSQKSGIYINYLEWIPDANGGALIQPTIELISDNLRMETGSNITEELARVVYVESRDLNNKLQYTITDIDNAIASYTLPTAANNKISLTAASGITENKTVTITVSLPATNDYAAPESKTVTITVHPTTRTTNLNKLQVGTKAWTNVTDDADMLTVEVAANASRTITYPISVVKESSEASVSVSVGLRATVSTPANLTYTTYSGNEIFYMPEAAGYSTYYYIKVTCENLATKYYCVRLHRKAGDKDLEVWDQTMGWTNVDNDGYNSWPVTGTQNIAAKLLEGYMYIHMPTEGKDVDINGNSGYSYYMNASEFNLRLAGCMSGSSEYIRDDSKSSYSSQFAQLVAEIKVSGSGVLTLTRQERTGNTTNRPIIIGIPNADGGIIETHLSAGSNNYEYTGGPTSIFISSSHNNNYIHSLIWTPADAVQNQDPPSPATQPYIVWSGTEGFMYGTSDHTLSAKAYYHGKELGSVAYNVVRGRENIGVANNNTIPGTQNGLTLGGHHAGTVMIRANIGNGTNSSSESYNATNSYYIFNVSKQTPTIIVDEITTTIKTNSDKSLTKGLSEKAIKEYVTEIEGVMIDPNDNTKKVTETVTSNPTAQITVETNTTLSKGHYTIVNDKAQGEKLGRGQVKLTWTPTGNDAANYLSTHTIADVVVISKDLTMRFTKTTGTGGCNRPYKAHVLCMDGDKKIEGLKIKYTIIEDNTKDNNGQNGATLNEDGTAVIPGSTPGTIKIKAWFYRDSTVNDLNSYYDDTDTGDDRVFTLNVQEAYTLTQIPDDDSYTSENLSYLTWDNETRPSAGKVKYPTPYQFITDNNYISSATGHEGHHFRFHPANRDELVRNSNVDGLYIKDKDSWLSFYAVGSARLELTGYSSVARVIEVWAVNNIGWDGYADPEFEDGAKKVAEIKVPAGEFTAAQAFADLTVAGVNYYFLKTSFGGVYLSTIAWKHARSKPYMVITSDEGNDEDGTPMVTLTNTTSVQNILNDGKGHTENKFHIEAWTYASNDEEHSDDEPETGAIYIKYLGTNTEKPFTVEGTQFHYESLNEHVATVNPKTSVITPNNPGTADIFVYLEAGKVWDKINEEYVEYGSQRVKVRVVVPEEYKVADVFFGEDLTETSVIYSAKTGKVISDNCDTGGTWLTPTVRDATNYTTLSPAAYSLEYRLETLDGKDFDTKIAEIGPKTGVVTFKKKTDNEEEDVATDGTTFRVVVKFHSDIYVNQQSYYVVKYTTMLTEPTIAYNAEDGMKELNTPNLDGAFGTGTRWSFDKEREYFIPADKDAELTFTLPEPLNGLTMHAIILNNLQDKDKNGNTIVSPPTSGFDVNTTGNQNTMKVTIPLKSTGSGDNTVYHHQVKYVWMRVTKPIASGNDAGEPDLSGYQDIWNGAYKITFLTKPSAEVSGSKSNTSRTVTITSNNPTNAANTTSTYYTHNLYYSEDSSTPTGESYLYDFSDKPTYTSNAVLHAVEIFSPTGGFTDGTANFASPTLNNIEVEIIDDNVIAAADDGLDLKSNWNNQLRLPSGATAQTTEMRIMFGGDGGRYYGYDKDKGLGFYKGGMGWKQENGSMKVNGHDSGIPFYCDIYKEYVQSQESSDLTETETVNGTTTTIKKDPNPRTEYNGDIGGKGTNTGIPYMTPISGAFFRLEPEYNGIATIWIRQNGASASSAWGKTHESGASEKTRSDKAQLTRRPVYVMDENGKLLPNNTAQYNSGYSLLSQYKDINGVCADVSKRSTLDSDFMWGWNCFKDYVAADRKTINRKTMEYYHAKYGFYVDFDLDENGDGYFEEFKVCKNSDYKTNTSRTANGSDISRIPIDNLIYTDNPEIDEDWETFKFVAGGYETPMPNYVRYRIPVQTGKTYFLSGRQTKNAFCAVKFEKFTEGNSATEITIGATNDDNTTTTGSLAGLTDGQLLDVTLNRTFTEGYWHPVVLPFSVSETKMREIFGDDVQVLYLDSEQPYEGTGNTFKMPYAVKTVTPDKIDGFEEETCDIMFTQHYYQMLYANTPAFIKPTFKWYTRNTDGTVNMSSTPSRNDPWGNAISMSSHTDQTKTDFGKYQRTSVNFKNVTYVKEKDGKPKTIDIGAGYDLVGTYDYKTAKGDIYYINNEIPTGETAVKGVIHHNNTKGGVNFKATTCWIQRRSGVQTAPIRRVRSSSFTGEDITASHAIFSMDGEPNIQDVNNSQNRAIDPHIYNLQGVVVGTVDDNTTMDGIRRGLAPGIYIYRGKKIIMR